MPKNKIQSRKKNKRSLFAPKELMIRVQKRIDREYGSSNIQKGGTLSSEGSFGNMVTQLFYFIENGIDAAANGIKSVISIVELPGDMAYDLDRPNEPLPSNTPLHHAIDLI